jgi:hypothetical protein
LKNWKEWALLAVMIIGLAALLFFVSILTASSAVPKSEVELLEQASEMKERLTASAEDYLESAATGFQLDRSLRIQERLFREDLAWQARGFSKNQMDLMVFVVVALSLERVDDEIAMLKEKGGASARQCIGRIEIYKYQALILLNNLSGRLEALSSSEFAFYF